MKTKALNPNFYLFNPTCEYAVANGNVSWQANRTLQNMESDLATLPLFFAEPNDYVWVNRMPSKNYIQSLKKLALDVPHFVTGETTQSADFRKKQWNCLMPWGWSPAAHKQLRAFKVNCSEDFKTSPVFEWNPAAKDYYSKRFALDILKKIKDKYPHKAFPDNDQIAKICTKKSEIEQLLEAWGKLMIKAPWSSSGRGLQKITKTPVHEKVWERILGIIKEQGYALVEPYRNKQADIAFQFEIIGGKVRYLGVSNFFTDAKGQYQGNYLNGLPDSVDPAVKNFIDSTSAIIIESLIQAIEESNMHNVYEGKFGVDTLIYRASSGELKTNPCQEINLRHNMGLLCLQLAKYIVPEQRGTYQMWYRGGQSFGQFSREMQKKHPLVLKNGKIESGFFPVTDANPDSTFGAYLLV